MPNKVFKNYQIYLGMPFQVKVPEDETFEGHFSNRDENESDEYYDTFPGSKEAYEAEDGQENGPNEPITEEETDPAAEAARLAEQLVLEAEERCAVMIKEAEDKAGSLIADAQKQAGILLEASKKEGIEFGNRTKEESKKQGYQEGYAEGKAEYEMLVLEAQQIKAQTEADYSETMSGAEGDALALVMDVARKVIGEEMELNRQNILIMIKEAFTHCSNKDYVALKVSPDDYEYVRANKDVLLSLIEGVGKLEILMDMSMQTGSCLVETPLGNIDAGVDTKLKKIEETFNKVLGERPV